MPALHAACVANFKRCYKNPEGICNGLDKGLNDNAQKVNAALEEGARANTPAVGAFIYGRRETFCKNGADNSVESYRSQMQEFAQKCTESLDKNVPLPVAGCMFKSPNVTRSPGAMLACSRAVENSNWEQQVKNVCEAWCREKKGNCPPPAPPCFVHSNTIVEAYGFRYDFSALDRSICVIKPWGVWDRIWAVINPPNILYDRDQVVQVLQNPAMRNPAWSANVTNAFNDAVVPGLSIGNCRSARTMLSANVQWTKTPVRTRLGQLMQQAPVSDTTRVALSGMFAIPLTPAVTESVALSLTPVALVPGFESCPATASLASRGSSGSDGSYTPRSPTTSVKRTPERGSATANRGLERQLHLARSARLERLILGSRSPERRRHGRCVDIALEQRLRRGPARWAGQQRRVHGAVERHAGHALTRLKRRVLHAGRRRDRPVRARCRQRRLAPHQTEQHRDVQTAAAVRQRELERQGELAGC